MMRCTEEFRSFVQQFPLVLIRNYFQFFIKAQDGPLEIFECVSTHLKTDHFKLGVLLETFFQFPMKLEGFVLLEYLLCLNDNLCLQKRLFHSLSASPRYTFWQFSCHIIFMNYVINLTFPFHYTFSLLSPFVFWSLAT